MRFLGALSAAAMAGIIWFVQIVHYPLFEEVGEDAWAQYHAAHGRRTSWVVAPLMIVELGTAAGIVAGGDRGALAIAGLLLAAGTWVITFLLAVPLHRRLDAVHELSSMRRLTAVNWLRTAAWTAHGVVAIALLGSCKAVVADGSYQPRYSHAVALSDTACTVGGWPRG